MKRYIIVIGLFLLAQSAWGKCPDYGPKPRTQVVLEFGKAVVDNTKSREEWPEKTSSHTAGVTVAYHDIQMQIVPKIKEVSGHTQCLYIEAAKFFFSFPQLNIYVDKKYRPGSCPYSVVIQHERKHVRIYQNTLYAYRGKLEAAFDKSVKQIKMAPVKSQAEANKQIEKIKEQIKKDMLPVIEKLLKETEAKHQRMDTEEAYQKEGSKCPKWPV